MGEHLVKEETVRTHELHTYFRPRSASSPAVDSWILIRHSLEGPPTLLIFQMSPDHDAQPIGLDEVNKLVRADARRYLVIFTRETTGTRADDLPKEGVPGRLWGY